MKHGKHRLSGLVLVTVLFAMLQASGAGAQGEVAAGSPINAEMVRAAEKVIGLTFTDVERDSMLEGIIEQEKNFEKIRKIHLDNEVPPALLFNPVPANWRPPVAEGSFKASDLSGTELPRDMNDLAFYSIGQLAELIRTGKLTSVKLTEFCLTRLQKYDPVLHCVITLTKEKALAQARRADAEIKAGKYRGKLHGIPYGIKDLFATKGDRTTWGAAPYKDQVTDEDATVVKKLDEAGAVLVAKLTSGALAMGDRWYGGKTRNPWNTEEGSSGSSAGPASAVSAGLVPFAIGTETWGSIVSPSTVCGVTALRPTFGRVSRAGAMALSWSMDKVGPICRTVEDCALVFNEIYGPDGRDPSVFDFAFSYDPGIDISSIRVGYLYKDFAGDYPFMANDSLALIRLKRLGIELIPIKLPEFPLESMTIILSAEAAAFFDELTRSGRDDLMVRQIKDAWPNIFRHSRFITAVEYINANRIRYELVQSMQKLMQAIDIYISPSWQGDNLLLTNLTGHPCVVLPNGFQDGKPTSFTFIGGLFDEGRLLAVAKKYQDATNFHLQHPNLIPESK